MERTKKQMTREELERNKDDYALFRAVEIASKDPEWAKTADVRRAEGCSRDDIAMSAALHCQMTSLGLKPWMSPPMWAHIERPTVDEEGAALLKRLLDAGLSPFEPDPVAACEAAEAEQRQAAK